MKKLWLAFTTGILIAAFSLSALLCCCVKDFAISQFSHLGKHKASCCDTAKKENSPKHECNDCSIKAKLAKGETAVDFSAVAHIALAVNFESDIVIPPQMIAAPVVFTHGPPGLAIPLYLQTHSLRI